MDWSDVIPCDQHSVPLMDSVDLAEAFAADVERVEAAFWLDGGRVAESVIGHGTRVPAESTGLAGVRQATSKIDANSLGVVGWLGYELGAESVRIPVSTDARTATALLDVRELVVVSVDGQTRLVVPASTPRRHLARRATALRRAIRAQRQAPRCTGANEPAIDTSQPNRWLDSDAGYAEKIRTAQAHIRAGDVYQLCLTTRIEASTPTPPLTIYERLRSSNGTRRGGLIRIHETWILSSSPEQFLSVDASGVVSTSPIKGTRRRDDDVRVDELLAEELRTDIKERAENVMIVDLMRNDLGRVCETGSVSVSRLFEVESHPQVHQLVSTIHGQLRPGIDVADLIAATFPAGSMTGAPKRRAMELIEGIECGPRGLYAGAFGYFGADRVMELSMTIRTIVWQDGAVTIGTGGGITALSVPDDEVAEIHLKARALLDAIAGDGSTAP